MQHQCHSSTQAEATLSAFKSRKHCSCQKSHCFNGHCKCFASGVLCHNCNCINCCNDEEHEREQHKLYLDRKVNTNIGCNCKRSSCLKNYCKCFEAGIKCSISCTCVGCRNYRVDVGVMSAQNTWPGSVITSAVVEAVCGSLLVQAELAENIDLTAAQAERMLLQEFGRCLTQITEAMFND
ncbi:protein lin-54 homolog isoform X2 [Cynoglossus semilaevis]|uniref:protein lin-54 homolog isoform X2 n=1 Tax=Cynoglossus semilaevis TaxID=244447 RepID=UPI0004970C01|nr:protein lin-54 homolog isoform X2 [Cynoglossus semilaevis]